MAVNSSPRASAVATAGPKLRDFYPHWYVIMMPTRRLQSRADPDQLGHESHDA